MARFMRTYRALISSDIVSINDLPCSKELHTFAEVAFQRYSEWFGPRKDLQWPAEILIAAFPNSFCTRGIIRHRYLIGLRKPDMEGEALYNSLCRSLAHEMYHRITMRRQGLRQVPWVDETLAFVATARLLRAEGLGESIAAIEQRYLQTPRLPDALFFLPNLRSLRRFSNGQAYPHGFAATTGRTAMAFEFLLGWESLRSLVHHKNWTSWLNTLPEKKRSLFLRLIPHLTQYYEPGGKTIDALQNIEDHERLGMALIKYGEHQEAISEFEAALREAPENTDLLCQVANARWLIGEWETAVQMWQSVVQQDPDNYLAHYNLAVYYQETQQASLELQEWEQTLRIDPANEEALERQRELKSRRL